MLKKADFANNPPFKFCDYLDGVERAGLSYWCLVIAVWLFLAVRRVCLQFVIVVFSDHTHLQFSTVLQRHEV